jgi:hypothetical protein
MPLITLPRVFKMSPLSHQGHQIHRGLFTQSEIEQLRIEAEAVAKLAGTTCVRHICTRSELFDRLALAPRLKTLLPPDLSPVRSILFDKTPTENWPVLWHQDLTIAVTEKVELPGYGPWTNKDGAMHVQPPTALLESMITVRIHLDETPASNGALRLMPETHRRGRIPSDQVSPLIDDTHIVAECSPGDVLLMSPLILHSSRKSTLPSRRRILHFEYAKRAELDPQLTWFESDQTG